VETERLITWVGLHNYSGESTVNLSVAAAATCVAVLTGCTAVQQRYAPDDVRSYALNCSGTGRNCKLTYTAANEACGAAGYDIRDRSSEDVAMAAAGSNSSGYGGSAVKTNERTMRIACKVK